MKVRSLSGKVENLHLGKYSGNERTDVSKLHLRVRLFLRAYYPSIRVLEEVHIPVENLYMDFYLPLIKVCIEAHGIQHTQDNRFFFKTNMDFYRAKSRDRRKIEWCELNNIILLEFYENELEENWKKKLDSV